MASSAFWTYGSTLQLGDGATPTEAFTSIAEITEDLNPPQMSRESIDVTSHDSSDGYMEFIPGMRDGGEVSFGANWLPGNATHDETTGLISVFNDDDNHNWKIVAPDSVVTVTFAGHVTAFNPVLGGVNDKGSFTCTIKVSGKPTFDSTP